MKSVLTLFSYVKIDNWEAELEKVTLMADAQLQVVHRPGCSKLSEREGIVVTQWKAAMKTAWNKAAKTATWANDQGKLEALREWSNKKAGSRGACPVELPDYLKEALVPPMLTNFVPVNVLRMEGYKRCQTCTP